MLTEIYSFGVGDVFVYKTVQTTYDGPDRHYTDVEYDKCTIAKKEKSGDTLTIVRDFNGHVDSIILVDSSTHPLNYYRPDTPIWYYMKIVNPCNGHHNDTFNYNIIPVFFSDGSLGKLATQDEITKSQLRNSNGYLSYDDAYKLDDCTFHWKNGLGITHRKGINFETVYQRDLVQYITGNDTTHFRALNTSQLTEANFSIYLNPTFSQLYIHGAINSSTHIIYDLQGGIILYGAINQSMIDVSLLKQGIYILVLRSGLSEYRRRFVKL